MCVFVSIPDSRTCTREPAPKQRLKGAISISLMAVLGMVTCAPQLPSTTCFQPTRHISSLPDILCLLATQHAHTHTI